MRKVSPLVGLTLVALASTARAQPTATPAAPPAAAPVVVPAPAPAPAPVPVAAPPPAATIAPAAVTAEAPAPAAPSKRKLQVGLSLLSMGMGKYKYTSGSDMTTTSDASFAYGVGLSVGYEVIPHLIVGLAPQVVLNVQEKVPEIATTASAAKEYDFLARVAYVYPVADGTEVYAEVLPGYSTIVNESNPKGFVVSVGVGGLIDISERGFVSLGAGYQMGFQKWKEGANTLDTGTSYLRVALGGGIKF